MARKKMEAKVNRVRIFCPQFSGYLDEMPQEAKDRMKAEKPEVHKRIFGETPNIEQ